MIADALSRPYELTTRQVDRFRRDGFVKLEQLLSPETVERFEGAVTAKVLELNTMHLPLEERSLYHRAFLQVMNLWRHSDRVRELVFSSRLASTAAELLGVQGVRLYHDQAIYKEPGGGITPWHADQYYWPLASEKTCTAWIPLVEVSIEMGPLSFACGSHRLEALRELPISDESERLLEDALDPARFPRVEEPFAVGDVSFHYGRTFHRAGANTSDRPRKVLAVSYMDADIRVAEPANGAQRRDLKAWLVGAAPGERPDGPLNPVLYSGRGSVR